MLDPVDETFFEFVDTCLPDHAQTQQLQRKFAALGGVDLVVRLVAMSMNDEVIVKASRALSMLLQIEGNVGDSSLNSTPRSASAAPSLAGSNVNSGGGGGMSNALMRSTASVCSVASSTSAASNAGARSHAVVNAVKICAAGGVAALIAQMRRSRNDRVLQASFEPRRLSTGRGLLQERVLRLHVSTDDGWLDRTGERRRPQAPHARLRQHQEPFGLGGRRVHLPRRAGRVCCHRALIQALAQPLRAGMCVCMHVGMCPFAACEQGAIRPLYGPYSALLGPYRV
jgi:hypothetical protein